PAPRGLRLRGGQSAALLAVRRLASREWLARSGLLRCSGVPAVRVGWKPFQGNGIRALERCAGGAVGGGFLAVVGRRSPGLVRVGSGRWRRAAGLAGRGIPRSPTAQAPRARSLRPTVTPPATARS